jgi:transposase-like protein
MSRRIFTRKQINELLKNPYVTRCSEMAITYTGEFKARTVNLHREQHMTAKEIFIKSGFDLKVIGQNTPRWCLKRWSRTYKIKGEEKLRSESRGRLGGRPKKTGITDADRIKRLEAENAYLRAENDFLAKLRAKRAE